MLFASRTSSVGILHREHFRGEQLAPEELPRSREVDDYVNGLSDAEIVERILSFRKFKSQMIQSNKKLAEQNAELEQLVSPA